MSDRDSRPEYVSECLEMAARLVSSLKDRGFYNDTASKLIGELLQEVAMLAWTAREKDRAERGEQG
jgi:hypothetical protein